jgi:transcriptional regulator with XRE-family HTH domain
MAKRPATQRRVPKRRGPKPQSLPAYIRLADALVAWRTERHLRQSDLARLLGKPQSFVTKYETRKRRLDFVETVTVLDALGVSVDEAARLVRRR